MKHPSPWIVTYPSEQPARLRLFCFPYAGGGASVYHSWKTVLAPDIEICAIQYPGHETRLKEELLRRMDALIAALVKEMLPLSDLPFAFFGHSMGALVSFELARALQYAQLPVPSLLLLSSCTAAHVRPSPSHIHQLGEQEFIQKIRQYGGTPEAIFQHTELMSLFLPILRADLELFDTYLYQQGPLLTIPIAAFMGDSDKVVSIQHMQNWQELTRAAFSFHSFTGGHFYFQQQARHAFFKALMAELSASALIERDTNSHS